MITDPRAWLIADARDFRESTRLCDLGDHPEWVQAAREDVKSPLPKELGAFALIVGAAAVGLPKARDELLRIITEGAVDPGVIRLSIWLCAGYLSLDPARPKRGEDYPVLDLALLAANLWALVAEDGLEESP